MPETPPDNMTFSQYGVIVARLDELNRKVDRIYEQNANTFQDHEERIRSLEVRVILVISLGFGLFVSAIIITWILARSSL